MSDTPAVVTAVVRIDLPHLHHGANTRGELGDTTELAASLRAVGQLDPIQVEPDDGRPGHWLVFDGNRRLKAARLAGLTHLDAIVRKTTPADQRIVKQLAMHTHSRSFDPIAEARGIEELMFTYKRSREDIARLLGRSPGWVRDRLALLQLAPDEQTSVARGTLPVRQAVQTVAARRGHAEQRDIKPARHAAQRPITQTGSDAVHFGSRHPLAARVRDRCDRAASHRGRAKVGWVGCGECWEAVIRADERAAARPPEVIG